MIIERQGLLKGDLNQNQQLGLMWLMGLEVKDQIDLERYRAISTGLATNPATASDFIQGLLKEQEEEEEIIYTEQEWTTPRSIEEIEQFLREGAF
jgi:hypothetical protein